MSKLNFHSTVFTFNYSAFHFSQEFFFQVFRLNFCQIPLWQNLISFCFNKPNPLYSSYSVLIFHAGMTCTFLLHIWYFTKKKSIFTFTSCFVLPLNTVIKNMFWSILGQSDISMKSYLFF
jgi:hypothetical protein